MILLLFCLFFCLPLHVNAEEQATPFQIIRSVVEHRDKATLEGIRVMIHCYDNVVWIQGVHILRDQDHERFEYFPNAKIPYQLVIIDKNRVYHIKPAKKLIFGSPFDYHNPNEHVLLELAMHNFRWENEGDETLLGYRVERIVAIPKDSRQPAARFWIDTTSHVILREERYDHLGTLFSASYFAYLRFPKAISQETFDIPHDFAVRNFPARTELEGSAALTHLDFKPIIPKKLLHHFVLIGTYQTEWHDFRKLHLLYSDGLRTVSVYENLRHWHEHPMNGSMTVSVLNHSYEMLETPEGKLLRFSDGPISIAIIGNLSSHQIAKMALKFGTPERTSFVSRMSRYFLHGLDILKTSIGLK